MFKNRILTTLVIALIGMLVPYSVSAATSPNYAQGKSYTTSVICASSFGNENTLVTDGNKYSSAYITDNGTGGSSPVSLIIDMKAVYTLNEIKVWHYSADGRTFHNTKTEISEDNVTWTPVFDSAATGSAEYIETENGKVHLFQPVKARYIRDWINGSDKDSENRWVEIQAFGPQQTGNDVKQNQPISNAMENTIGITGLNPGTVTLTQDKVGGSYAVKVVAENAPSNSVSYTLTASDPFNIAEFRQIKIWVKPGSGAQWIKFKTNNNDNNQDCYFKNDLDGDGVFKVGTDLVSGKWNQITLDLSKTSSPQLAQAKDLKAESNDLSTWLFDEISSVYSPVATIDISKMENNQTEWVNNELRFKANGNKYDTNPTVLMSGKISELSDTDSAPEDFDGDKANTVVDDQGNIILLPTNSFSHLDTNTEDFDGTHSNTKATNNSVILNNDPYTKLLLHMDGADNGTAFTDECGKTVTRTGDTCTKTAQKKLGSASAYFDGSGDYLSLADSDDWTFGAGDFTIDFWANPSRTGNYGLGGQYPNSGVKSWYLFSGNNNADLNLAFTDASYITAVAGSNIALNTWHHIAFVRQGSSLFTFLNGALINTYNIGTKIINDASTPLILGRVHSDIDNYYYQGYIDEFRISKGIARWTSNFTPPTSAYTAFNIDGSNNLLLHMDGTNNGTSFTDEYGKTVTRNGDTCTKTSTKEFGSASAYFDGTGDYLTLADSDSWYFGAADFTIDFWINTPNVTNGQYIISQNESSGEEWRILYGADGKLSLTIWDYRQYYAQQLAAYTTASSVFIPNTWTHIAWARQGTNIYCFINGTNTTLTTIVPISTRNLPNLSAPLAIGAFYGYATPGNYLIGYLDEVRISKGIARWTSNFTPPTVPYGPFGTYTHTIQDISSGGTANPATITFNKTTPANTSLTVEVSTDGGNTWVAKNSGDSIFPNGTNLTGKTVQWRANLSSSDPAVSPSLDDVTISASNGYPTTGTNTYTSPSINISSVGTASSSSITWNQTPAENESSAATVEVKTNISTDGGATFLDTNWQSATNGGVILGIPVGTDLTNYRLKYRVTLSTTDPSITPTVSNININIQGPLQGSTPLDSKISGININSGYTTSAGPITAPDQQKTYLSSVAPTIISISGDGNSVYYKNPTDNKLNLLNLLTGANTTASNKLPTVIKTNFDGTKAAFTETGGILYLYNSANNTTTQISAGVTEFEIQKDGTIYYATSAGAVYCYQSSMTAPGTSCITGLTINHLTASKTGSTILYSNALTLNTIQSTPNGWKTTLLTTAAKTIDAVWTNLDGFIAYFKTADGLFEYRISSKSCRSVEVDTSTVINITDDNKLAILGTNNEFRLYDANADSSASIRPGNASGTAFDVDDSGQKMAYAASDGLASNWINGVQKPERYLLSLDGKNSWYTFKNAKWQLIKSGGIPTVDDLKNYGMTIDQVNAISEQDFNSLYTNGKEIYSIDVAVYMASPDAFTTPSLKGIVISLKGKLNLDSADGQIPLQKPLFTMKQQSFNSAKWRQMKKIYPVELYPREGETYYFISTDGTTYKTYKDGSWQTVDPALLSDVENKWIELTQKGMTAQELRSIPADALNMLLPADSITVGYIQKVQDMSTQGYTSQISIDYVESEYESANLILKITLTDNTIKTYTGLTKSEVEDFTAWIAQRQANKGPLFHKIKTKSTTQGVIQVNEYINYYMIQYFSVEEMS